MVSIIIPTYCEAENLPRLLPRLLQVMSENRIVGEVVIVDDDSPDETAGVCLPFIQDHEVHLHVRHGERGLSSAVLHGVRVARGETVVVMDADLSHPPEAIPRLLAALEDGADMALGSRYVAGGSTADAWTTWRWLNSQAATLLAKPLTGARDPMAGFMAIHRQRVIDAWDRLSPVGYKIALELIIKCGCKRVAEVPIRFEDRAHGESKLSIREQLNYLRHVGRLYKYRLTGRASGGAPRPLDDHADGSGTDASADEDASECEPVGAGQRDA